jgi:DNA modification methylase
MTVKILVGNTLDVLKDIPSESVHCCVTSPPYWGLRSYLPDGHQDKPHEIGLEATPEAFVARMVEVFREVRRVLRKDGTCWLNLGDSYAGGKVGNTNGGGSSGLKRDGRAEPSRQRANAAFAENMGAMEFRKPMPDGLKPKDLIGIPWRVALALQADGWWLRSDVIWSKPNPMPESVTDRPTKAHEYLFILTKSERYWYDAEAIKEGSVTGDARRPYGSPGANALDPRGRQGSGVIRDSDATARNARSVWTIATAPFGESHFAVMPPALAERCIKAGCPVGGTVLDPFGGAGTTGLVADRLQRNAILIEINPEYAAMASKRIANDAGGLFATVDVQKPTAQQMSLLEAAE